MRYAIINKDRIILNTIEVLPEKSSQFDAHYLGESNLGIGDRYPVVELQPTTEPQLLGQALTDLTLSDIERGQETTDLLLDQIAQGQDMTDMQLTLLEGKS